MRKLIIIALLLAGFITACKQQLEKLPVKVNGSEVTYATDSTNLKGYIAFDENNKEKRPGILIVHEWWGHNDYVRERALCAAVSARAFSRLGAAGVQRGTHYHRGGRRRGHGAVRSRWARASWVLHP